MKKIFAIFASIVIMFSMTIYQSDILYASEENNVNILESKI